MGLVRRLHNWPADISERDIFQLVGMTLVIVPMTIQIPLVPNITPLCEEVVNHCGCPIHGIVLLGSFVANVIALSFYPLLGDPTFEQEIQPMDSWAAARFLRS